MQRVRRLRDRLQLVLPGAEAGLRANVYHFLLVTVNGNQVTVTPTDSTGRTFDVQTYMFSG